MLHTFKTSSSPEVSDLIKKHGTTNALFIKNLSYFTNVALRDIDEIGYKSMKTGSTGVLKFWSNQLAGDKIHFLTARAHTIINARGKGPFTNHDLDFVHFVASSIKSEVASTNKTLADFAEEHGDILDLAYEVSKVKYKALKFDVLGNLNAAMAEFAIASSQSETLVEIEAAIAELEHVSKAFTSSQTLLEEQLQRLHQEREALKK